MEKLLDGENLTDCYYLEQTYNVATTNATALTKTQMQSQEFITMLNTITTTIVDETTGEEKTITTMQNAWVKDSKNINKGYPILSWQQ